MSKLADLKKAAADKLTTVHQDVTNYVAALEASVASNRVTYIVVGAVCLVVGGVLGHVL